MDCHFTSLNPLILQIVRASYATSRLFLSPLRPVCHCPLWAGESETDLALDVISQLFLAPFTSHCRIVFAMPEEREMSSYHPNLRKLTVMRRSSQDPMASRICCVHPWWKCGPGMRRSLICDCKSFRRSNSFSVFDSEPLAYVVIGQYRVCGFIVPNSSMVRTMPGVFKPS